MNTRALSFFPLRSCLLTFWWKITCASLDAHRQTSTVVWSSPTKMTPKPTRYHPNIIITGTPGCGKTSLSRNLLQTLPKSDYKHYNISELAKERDCIESYDKERDTGVVDEDKLLDGLENDLRDGGAIVDWHCCDIFPKRLIDLVVVLRTETALL